MSARVYIYEGEVVLCKGDDEIDAIELVDELGEKGENPSPMALITGKRSFIETPTLAEILELEFGGRNYIGSSKFHRPHLGDRSLGRLRLTAEWPCWPDPD